MLIIIIIMCGIFGVFGNYDNDKLYSLFMKIKKRGKHKSVYIEGDDYKVGFHRLSIIDKSINHLILPLKTCVIHRPRLLFHLKSTY